MDHFLTGREWRDYAVSDLDAVLCNQVEVFSSFFTRSMLVALEDGLATPEFGLYSGTMLQAADSPEERWARDTFDPARRNGLVRIGDEPYGQDTVDRLGALVHQAFSQDNRNFTRELGVSTADAIVTADYIVSRFGGDWCDPNNSVRNAAKRVCERYTAPS